jgi:hydroxymethylbilane synthase
LHLKGGILTLDGKERISLQVSGSISEPELVGEELAAKVLAAGGDRILIDIKKQMNS